MEKLQLMILKLYLQGSFFVNPSPAPRPAPRPTPKLVAPSFIRYKNQINTGIILPNIGEIIYIPGDNTRSLKFLIKIKRGNNNIYKTIHIRNNDFFVKEGSYNDEKLVKLPNEINNKLKQYLKSIN